MPFLPLKNPMPPQSEIDAVSLQVLNDMDANYPIVPAPQNYNGPYPQTDDVGNAYRVDGQTETSVSAQYLRVTQFFLEDFGGSGPDANSRARTQAWTVNHSNSQNVATWIKTRGSEPITRAFLGLSGGDAPAPPTPTAQANARRISALEDRVARLEAKVD